LIRICRPEKKFEMKKDSIELLFKKNGMKIDVERRLKESKIKQRINFKK